MSRKLYDEEPDIGFLFENWRFNTDLVYKMLSYETQAGGPYNIEEAACQILRNEKSIDWVPWVKIHNRCSPAIC